MSSSTTGFNPDILIELVSTKIYFGKYKGRLICDIPVYYLEWLDNNGMPKGKIGMLLSTMLLNIDKYRSMHSPNMEVTPHHWQMQTPFFSCLLAVI